ncbi:unnamed protein product, partial [Symbiodinium microadriaticum]
AYLPKFSDEQISVVQERVLQTEWYHNQGKYQGPVPETMPGESSAAPSRSLTTAAGIWTAEPPPIKGRIASSGTPVAKEKATSSGTPVAKEKATSSAGDHGTPEEEATTAPVARYYRGGTEEYSCAGGRQTLGSVGATGSEQLGGFGRSVGALDRKAFVASPASHPSEGFGINGTRDAAESGASFSKKGTFAKGGIFSESSGAFSRGNVFTEGGGTEGGNIEVGGTSSAPATIISAAYPYGAITSTGGGSLPVGANELCGCPAQGNSVQPIGGEFSHAGDDGTYQARLTSAASSRQVRPRRALPVPPAAPGATPRAAAAPSGIAVIPGFGEILPPPAVPNPPPPRSRSPSPSSPPAVPGPVP